MNTSAQVEGVLKEHEVPTPIIEAFTKHVDTKAENINALTKYWSRVLAGNPALTDTVVYLNDMRRDETAWLSHFNDRVVPYLKEQA